MKLHGAAGAIDIARLRHETCLGVDQTVGKVNGNGWGLQVGPQMENSNLENLGDLRIEKEPATSWKWKKLIGFWMSLMLSLFSFSFPPLVIFWQEETPQEVEHWFARHLVRWTLAIPAAPTNPITFPQLFVSTSWDGSNCRDQNHWHSYQRKSGSIEKHAQ